MVPLDEERLSSPLSSDAEGPGGGGGGAGGAVDGPLGRASVADYLTASPSWGIGTPVPGMETCLPHAWQLT